MASVKVTVTGDREVKAEFDEAARQVAPEIEKIVSKGSLNVKTDWKAAWENIKHAPHIPRSISYDIEKTDTGFSSEIGPEDDPVTQGFLGSILELGGIHNAPVPGGIPALEKEEPKFTEQVEALMKKLLP